MNWKKRFAWGMSAFVLFFVFTLMIGTVTSVQPANAAVLVTDVNNILENTKTAINTATTAINTATQITNQNRNLASMSSDGLLGHYVALSQELSKVTGVQKAYTGLMNSVQTAEESWSQTFKGVDSILTGTSTATQRTLDGQGTMRSLELTYRDSLKSAKTMSDTSNTGQALQTALNKSANADGIKEATQASTQINSLIAQEAVKTNQQLGDLVTMEAAKGQAQIEAESRVEVTNRSSANEFTAASTAAVTAVKADKRSVFKKQGYSDEDIDKYYKKFL